MTISRRWLAVGLAALVPACGNDNRTIDARKVGDAVAEIGNTLTKGSAVDPVDFRALKALLPADLAGFRRVNAEGSRTNVMGVASSRALAAYEDGKGGRLEVELLDMGSFTGVASLTFAWVKVEMDKESDDGYERTLMLDGRKAYERYSKRSRSGELDVLVASRFVATLRGTRIDPETFRKAVKAIDFTGLEALQRQGAPATAAAR